MHAIAVGTIVAKNFLSFARVLGWSLRQHHPDVPFFVVLADQVDGRFDPAAEPFEVVPLEHLGIRRSSAVVLLVSARRAVDRSQAALAQPPPGSRLRRRSLSRRRHSGPGHTRPPLAVDSRAFRRSDASSGRLAVRADRVARELNILQCGVVQRWVHRCVSDHRRQTIPGMVEGATMEALSPRPGARLPLRPAMARSRTDAVRQRVHRARRCLQRGVLELARTRDPVDGVSLSLQRLRTRQATDRHEVFRARQHGDGGTSGDALRPLCHAARTRGDAQRRPGPTRSKGSTTAFRFLDLPGTCIDISATRPSPSSAIHSPRAKRAATMPG